MTSPSLAQRERLGWRLCIVGVVMVLMFTLDLLIPELLLFPFLVVPVVLSAAWVGPSVVALLTGVSVLMVVASGLLNDYFTVPSNLIWVILVVVAGCIAVAVAQSRVNEEESGRDTLERLRAGISMIDPFVVLQAVRDQTDSIIDFEFVDANDAAAQFNGMSRDELIGVRLLGQHPAAGTTTLFDDYVNVVVTGEPIIRDDWSYPQDLLGGELRLYDVRAIRVHDGLAQTWRDVTERHLAAREIADSEERFRILAENSSDVVFQTQAGVIVWVSPSLTQALGWQPADWLGHAPSEFISLDDLLTVEAARERMRAGESVSLRFRVRSATGTWHWVEGHSSPFRGRGGPTEDFQSSLRIIDSLVMAEEALKWRATRDDLTGALRRDEALTQLQEITHNPRTPGSVAAALFVDVDDFKGANDALGHAAGDGILRQLALVIRDCVRGDDAVARLGGDEFLVILGGLHNLDDATAIAEKISQRFAEPITLPEGVIAPTVSIGVTSIVPSESAHEVIARADRAMFEAKSAGRNQVVTIPVDAPT